jgi:hypothetical protein
MKNTSEKILLKKNIAAIVLLWIFGSVMIVLLILPPVKSFSDDTLMAQKINLIHRDAIHFNTGGNLFEKQLKESDAFVFVNINKKKMLTRFVSFANNDKPKKPGFIKNISADVQKDVTTLKKLIPPAKQQVSKPQAEFSIRPTPGI